MQGNRMLRRARLLFVIALACVVVFDSVGMLVNRLTADEAAQVAAEQAAAALVSGMTAPALWLDTAAAAARDSLADQKGVELIDLRVEDGRIVLSVRRRARVLLADRIGALRDHVVPALTVSAPIG
jgi:hypothetical protein